MIPSDVEKASYMAQVKKIEAECCGIMGWRNQWVDEGTLTAQTAPVAFPFRYIKDTYHSRIVVVHLTLLVSQKNIATGAQDMSGQRMVFEISYRSLLLDICDCLGWNRPIYKAVYGEEGRAAVELLGKCKRFAFDFKGCSTENMVESKEDAFEFKGCFTGTMVESEEDAARQAIIFLMEKENITVVDVNYANLTQFEECADIFRKKKYEISTTKVVSSGLKRKHPKSEKVGKSGILVSICFQNLLLDILRGLQIVATPTEIHVT